MAQVLPFPATSEQLSQYPPEEPSFVVSFERDVLPRIQGLFRRADRLRSLAALQSGRGLL